MQEISKKFLSNLDRMYLTLYFIGRKMMKLVKTFKHMSMNEKFENILLKARIL